MLNTREPLPTSTSSTSQAVRVTWDTIRVSRGLGLAAVAILGPRCGAVIDDPRSDVLDWFVAPGSAASWSLTDTRALPSGRNTVIPPLRLTHGPGRHWIVCPGEEGWLTDIRALEAALEDCLSREAGQNEDLGAEAEA
ncbi:hypothetical protein OG824_32060 [Streptomyces prunicolor]|uniref:hypothetical protein n=1 Tax=Streptomyces prunicolor TaxID=67348 RepID=UPI00225A46CB|nr:hypothetical protein [Streptomyces prunicolor]MCX5239847.1 hypothetical protein [Streptomyces prunicolor]